MNNQEQADEYRYEQFLALFSQHYERLLRYIFSLVPNFQDAEDICQKTSIILWRKFVQKEPEEKFFAWACKVAYFEVRNYRRTHARDRLFFNEDLMATIADDRLAMNRSTSRHVSALQQCMQGLSISQRELIEEAYSGERSIGQLAEHLGRAAQTVYNRLYRIRRILFDCVQKKAATGEASS